MQKTDTPADARRQEPAHISVIVAAVMARIIATRGGKRG